MKILKELTHIVTKNKVKCIDIIGNPNERESQISEFYHKLSDNHFQSDAEAALYFGCTNENNSNYKRVKNALRDRLINTLFFIDVNQPHYSDQQRALINCYKEAAAAMILRLKSAPSSYTYLYKRILQQAVRYEFTELILESANQLRSYYGHMKGDLAKFEYYNDLYKQHESIWLAENRADGYFVEIMTYYAAGIGTNQKAQDLAVAYWQELKSDLEKYTSFRFHLKARMIEVSVHMSANDFRETLAASERAITFFQQKPYEAKLAIQIFAHQKVVACTQLKLYEQGIEAAELAKSLLEPGSFNWFRNGELTFILSMHTNQYQNAYKVLLETTEHPRFEFLGGKASLEKWRIYDAYLLYLVSIKKIALTDEDKHFARFGLAKFLNEVPTFTKDKKGMNISILIVQILFLILQKKYDAVIDRIEAVEKYCSRYLLKSDDTYRSNCFIKMLLQLPISGFHRNGAMRRAAKFLELLQQRPLEQTHQPHDVEIIPYEIMWAFVLDSLSNTLYKSTPKTAPTTFRAIAA